MDKPGIRRANLHRVLALKFDGNQSALARKVGRQPSFINDLLRGEKSFGEKLARALEQKIGLGDGDLDLSSVVGMRQPKIVQPWPFEIDQYRFERLPEKLRHKIGFYLETVVHDYEQEPAGGKPAKKRRAG